MFSAGDIYYQVDCVHKEYVCMHAKWCFIEERKVGCHGD